MLLGIQIPLILLILYLGTINGDPTILLNAPMGSGLGGAAYGIGGPFGGQMLFDRDDVDYVFGPATYGSPMMPQAMPVPAAKPPTIVVVDRASPGGTVFNNDISPIPGVRYVMPNRRRSSSRRSSYYRRRNSFRRRYGYY